MLTIRSNGTWLHGLPGAVTGLKFSASWPIGCLTASWTMSLPNGYAHPALVQGGLVDIMAGPLVVWSGVLTEPDRESWEFTADGHGLLVSQGRVAAVDGSKQPTTKIATAVTAAAARGWGFTGAADLPTTSFSAASESSSNLNTLGALLDAYCEQNTKRWVIGPDRVLRILADPVAPAFALTPGVPVMATADDDYVSLELVRYLSSTTGVAAIASAEDATARDRWGPREVIEDQTAVGAITAAGATGIAQALLATHAARPKFSEGIEVARPQITTLGGTSPEPWEVVRLLSSGLMVRHHGALTSGGGIAFGSTLDWVVGSAEYEAGSSTLSLAPVDLAPATQAAVVAAQTRALKTRFK